MERHGAEPLLYSVQTQCLRMLSVKTDRHWQGLASAARYCRKQHIIDDKLCRKLTKVDEAYNLCRHITAKSCQLLIESVQQCFDSGLDGDGGAQRFFIGDPKRDDSSVYSGSGSDSDEGHDLQEVEPVVHVQPETGGGIGKAKVVGHCPQNIAMCNPPVGIEKEAADIGGSIHIDLNSMDGVEDAASIGHEQLAQLQFSEAAAFDGQEQLAKHSSSSPIAAFDGHEQPVFNGHEQLAKLNSSSSGAASNDQEQLAELLGETARKPVFDDKLPEIPSFGHEQFAKLNSYSTMEAGMRIAKLITMAKVKWRLDGPDSSEM